MYFYILSLFTFVDLTFSEQTYKLLKIDGAILCHFLKQPARFKRFMDVTL